VLSLTKLRPRGRHYYVRELGGPEVSRAGPGYWTENPELQGMWLGRGAKAIGLELTAVSEVGFDRLFGSGADPGDGRALGRGWDPESETAVAGYALTFSPPKSVSVLWATGDDWVSGEVGQAQMAAVAEALAYLEDHAGFTRRGRGGIYQVDTEGLIAAAFEHRTSRAADPQLHMHVLVSNKVRARDDGKWLSVDGVEVYRSQKAAGLVYKAALRAEMTRRLGLSWTPVDENGIAEVVGVPEGLAERWSKRRDQVLTTARKLVAEKEATLGRTLTANERAQVHQIAANRTRAPKVCGDEPTEVLRARWRQEARTFGYNPSLWMDQSIGHSPALARRMAARSLGPRVSVAQAREILESRHATWGRAEAVEVIATVLPTSGFASATSARVSIERAADALLRDSEVVCLAGPLPAEVPASIRRADGMAAVGQHGAVRFTTRTTLRREAAVLEAAARGIDAGLAVVPAGMAADALAGSGLGPDQADAVGHLLGGGERIVCLVGPAGTGKSRSLAAARTAWGAAGRHVVGLAPSARAAAVLAESSGITADTLAKFLHDAASGGPALPRGSVVVLDEASMAATADLAALVGHVESAGAKLVLVGDDHQLGAVGAGGLFATLVADHGAAELSTVRRFAHAWERAASLRLRAGDPAVLPTYRRHGRVLGGDVVAMVDEAFAEWSRARAEGASVLVMAADKDTVDALALRARAARVAAGGVSARCVPAARQEVGEGDDVLSLRNDRRLRTDTGEWVRNGSRWVVTTLEPDGAAVLSSMEGAGIVRVPRTYVSEHLALAYAATIHKSQGLTVDEGIVIVTPAMTAESLYVGMTRGRRSNRALVVCEGDDTGHATVLSAEPLEVMGRVLSRPGAEASAHQVLRAELARYDDRHLLSELVEEHRRHVDALAGPDRSQRIEDLSRRADVGAARARLLAAEAEASRAIAARELAESMAAGAEAPSLRSRIPGRMGERARFRDHQLTREADWGLRQATDAERAACAELSAARHGVPQAERAGEELAQLRRAQECRLDWLGANPVEAGWGRALEERLAQAERRDLGRRRVVQRQRATGREPKLSRFPVPNLPEIDAAEARRRRVRAGLEPSISRDPPGRHLGGPGLSL
jgi:conjugative relaxase-like TrwC/TraI family protein